MTESVIAFLSMLCNVYYYAILRIRYNSEGQSTHKFKMLTFAVSVFEFRPNKSTIQLFKKIQNNSTTSALKFLKTPGLLRFHFFRITFKIFRMTKIYVLGGVAILFGQLGCAFLQGCKHSDAEPTEQNESIVVAPPNDDQKPEYPEPAQEYDPDYIYEKDEEVLRNGEKHTIIKVYYDDVPPYYIVQRLQDGKKVGREIQTHGPKLRPVGGYRRTHEQDVPSIEKFQPPKHKSEEKQQPSARSSVPSSAAKNAIETKPTEVKSPTPPPQAAAAEHQRRRLLSFRGAEAVPAVAGLGRAREETDARGALYRRGQGLGEPQGVEEAALDS